MGIKGKSEYLLKKQIISPAYVVIEYFSAWQQKSRTPVHNIKSFDSVFPCPFFAVVF